MYHITYNHIPEDKNLHLAILFPDCDGNIFKYFIEYLLNATLWLVTV
jgi:hypothetical protein